MPKTARGAGGGKLYPLNMRTTKETRDRLQQAATDSGRSLAAEVEARLNSSFNQDFQEAALGGRARSEVAFAMISGFVINGGNSAPDKAESEWINDPDAYRAGIVGVLRELMRRFPSNDESQLKLTIEAVNSELLTILETNGHEQ